MEIKTKPITDFQPITIELTIRTAKELRLLYHVLNCSNVKTIIMNQPFYGKAYNFDITAENFDICPEDYVFIPEYLKKYGLSL